MRLAPATSLLLAALLATVSEARMNITARQNCNSYVVSGMPGAFKTRTWIDFSGNKATDNAQTVLASKNLLSPDWSITMDAGYPTHDFLPSNVFFTNGALNLRVQAYPGSGNVKAAEIQTTYSFKYGSVRTYMKSSSTPGVCEGNFLYSAATNEVDWEILTSNIDSGTKCIPQPGIWATNQATVKGGQKTSTIVPFNYGDPRTAFHQYRIDWSSSATKFYINGGLKATHTTNVPTQAGQWLWNAWSNGHPCWSSGPPTADSITQIRSIEIFRDWISAPTGTVCNY